jgi:DNA-binding transcriptional LysR family regulator
MAVMLNITLRRFEVFVAVAESGGFAAAADRLGVAQPSVSAHISALEEEVGGALFERRRGRTPVLTELGQTFLGHARQLLAGAENLTDEVTRSREQAAKRVTFACQRSIANYWLTTELAQFAREHPAIELIVRVGTQEVVLSQVESGAADIGCFISDGEIPHLPSTVIDEEPLVFVAAPEHPLARRASIEPSELERCPFVGAPRTSMFGSAMYRLMASIGIERIQLVSQATESQLLKEMVAAGVGVLCSLEMSVKREVDAGQLVRLPVAAPPLMMQVRQTQSQKRPPLPAAKVFTEYLQTRFRGKQRHRHDRRLSAGG